MNQSLNGPPKKRRRPPSLKERVDNMSDTTKKYLRYMVLMGWGAACLNFCMPSIPSQITHTISLKDKREFSNLNFKIDHTLDTKYSNLNFNMKHEGYIRGQ